VDRVLTEPFFWLLFIHIGAAVIGLGPSFIYARIGEAAGREPAHALFAMRLSRNLATRVTHPLAALVLLSGFGLIWVRGYAVFDTLWLLASVIIFTISFLYATFIQNPDLSRTLELIEKGPPDSLEEPERVELAGLRRRIRWGGMFMRGIVVVVLFLMVFKPF